MVLVQEVKQKRGSWSFALSPNSQLWARGLLKEPNIWLCRNIQAQTPRAWLLYACWTACNVHRCASNEVKYLDWPLYCQDKIERLSEKGTHQGCAWLSIHFTNTEAYENKLSELLHDGPYTTWHQRKAGNSEEVHYARLGRALRLLRLRPDINLV